MAKRERKKLDKNIRQIEQQLITIVKEKIESLKRPEEMNIFSPTTPHEKWLKK